MINSKKRGMVKITDGLIRDAVFDKDQEMIKAFQLMFGRFLVVNIKNNFFTNSLEYLGYCDDFEEVEEGIATPEYDVRFKRQATGKVTFEGFLRKK